MIEIRYDNGELGHSLLITGHAEYAPEGNDIVCAGVSALLYALLGYLIQRERDLTYFLKSGDAAITCGPGPDTDTAYEVTVMGLRQIAKKYPEHVTFTHRSAQGGDAREQTARKEHGDHAKH